MSTNKFQFIVLFKNKQQSIVGEGFNPPLHPTIALRLISTVDGGVNPSPTPHGNGSTINWNWNLEGIVIES